MVKLLKEPDLEVMSLASFAPVIDVLCWLNSSLEFQHHLL